MALYLKYRPQSLDDLIGQNQVKQALLGAFKADKLSHAYLFVGPRGTGKTSTARILAKMVNCELVQSSELVVGSPCNKCATCISITDGTNLDLIEIDAASNRGIDDIRALRETIKLSPSFSKKKIYIIDEVHMLTTEAFNALLKTLEEPPEHVLFILATTEVQKIPATIISRVTRLDFKLASSIEMLESLKKIAGLEKMRLTDGAITALAKHADGSFRDGVKLLDQVSSLEGEIKEEQIQELLNSSDFQSVIDLVYALSRKDPKEAITLVLKQIDRGVSSKNLLLALMDSLRQLLLIKNDLGSMLVKDMVGTEKYQVLTDLADRFEIKDLARYLDVLQNSSEKVKFAFIPSLPLELAVVEICSDATGITDKVTEKAEVGIPVREERLPQNTTTNTNSPGVMRLQEKWTFVLETIRPYNFSLEALLRSVKILDCSSGVVMLEVPYSFHQRILESPKSRDLLESVLSEVLSETVRVSCVLGNRPQRLEDIANIEVAADDEIISLASAIFQGKVVD